MGCIGECRHQPAAAEQQRQLNSPLSSPSHATTLHAHTHALYVSPSLRFSVLCCVLCCVCLGSKPIPPNPLEIDLTHFELLKVNTT